MKCDKIRELMNPYIDGYLDEEQENAIGEHIINCIECNEIYMETKHQVQMLGSLKEEDIPEGFHAGLMERLDSEVDIKEKEPKKFFKNNWIKWSAVAAAAVVILFSIKLLDEVIPVRLGSMEDSAGDFAIMESASEAMESYDMDSQIAYDTAEDEITAYGDNGKEKERFSDVEELVPMDNPESINTDTVELWVRDICVVPESLAIMALQYDIELVEEFEEGIVVEIKNNQEKMILYEQLSRFGVVRDVGQERDSGQVRIIIIRDE